MRWIANIPVTLLSVVVLATSACHCCHKDKLPVVKPVAGDTVIQVAGEIEGQSYYSIPPEGIRLDTLINLVKVKGNSARGDTGTPFVVISRADADYYFSLNLLDRPELANFMIQADERVRIVNWRDTDLARGLKPVEVKKLLPVPAVNANGGMTMSQFRDWFAPAAAEWKIAVLDSKPNGQPFTNTELNDPKWFKTLIDNLLVKIDPDKFDALSDAASPISDPVNQQKWISQELVQLVIKTYGTQSESDSPKMPLQHYTNDWNYLRSLYANRKTVTFKNYQPPPDVSVREAVDFTYRVPGELAAHNPAEFAVEIPQFGVESTMGHPNLTKLFGLLTVLPDRPVVRIVRSLNGKRTEFILPLLARAEVTDNTQAGNTRYQDYVRQYSTLVYDGDEVEVTIAARIQPILEGLILNVLNDAQRKAPPEKRKTFRLDQIREMLKHQPSNP